MRNRFLALAGLGLLVAACASENANTDADQGGSSSGNDSSLEGGHPQPGVDAGSPKPAPDGGATLDGACVQTELCVVGDSFDTTLCKCVPNVDAGSVDAACIDNVLCVAGDHFDRTLCKCLPNVDAAAVDAAAVDAACIDNVLCVAGDHFDRTLCKCLPNSDAAVDAGCVQTQLCIRGDHFDPTLCKCVPDASDGGAGCVTAADCKGVLPLLCQQCSDGSAACAHFTCVGRQCTIAYCP